jgi:transposase-like protein
MDVKEQIIKEYLEQGSGYRQLQNKYGICRTGIYEEKSQYKCQHGKLCHLM